MIYLIFSLKLVYFTYKLMDNLKRYQICHDLITYFATLIFPKKSYLGLIFRNGGSIIIMLIITHLSLSLFVYVFSCFESQRKPWHAEFIIVLQSISWTFESQRKPYAEMFILVNCSYLLECCLNLLNIY